MEVIHTNVTCGDTHCMFFTAFLLLGHRNFFLVKLGRFILTLASSKLFFKIATPVVLENCYYFKEAESQESYGRGSHTRPRD